MQEKNNEVLFGIIFLAIITIIGLSIGFSKNIKDYKGECVEYEYKIEELETQVEDLKMSLQEANDKIDKLNGQVEDARSTAGESYTEMRDALEELETEDIIDEP